MLELNEKDCCGCSACVSACHRNAISMIENSEGFLYPAVNRLLCIDCDLCNKVCICHNYVPKKHDRQEFYAAKDNNHRVKSQSGGIFSSLAKYSIENGYVVYGCMLDDCHMAYHGRVENLKELEKLRGSKYVQSDMRTCYCDVLTDLKSGRKVLFSGTPCQVAGLKKLIGNKFDELLFTVDIVCHGVPSPKIWSEYLDYLENMLKEKIIRVNFRDKTEFGWHSHVESVWTENRKYSDTAYTKLFYSHKMMRNSCYNCKFTNLDRPSDITVCDCWGIDKVMPDFDDNKGVSLVMINTSSGRDMFRNIMGRIDYRTINIKDYLQPQMQHSIRVNLHERQLFWKEYNEYGFDYVHRKHMCDSLMTKIKKYIKNIIGQEAINKIKNLKRPPCGGL